MAGSENDKKMELLHRAVGQIEGVAFFQSEVVRDLLLGSAEDITDGVESMKKKMESMEAVGLMQTTQIERLMKDKDDLLTENAKLREAGERIATSAAPPRNDKDGVPAGDPSVSLVADTSPCAGEAGEMKRACIICEGPGFIQPIKPENGRFAVIDAKSKKLIVKVCGEKRMDFNIKFCPACGREL